MHIEANTGLLTRLRAYEELVEVGVGHRHGVAAALADGGARVTTTDIYERDTPDGVAFVVDDVTDPELAVYRGADAVYALNCPPELQRPLCAAAARVDAEALFTTLGGDPAVVDATPESLPETTLFRLES